MGTKGITNLPITAVLKGKRTALYEQDKNIPVEGAPITTPSGNRPIKTMPESYLFNNQPKSPIDQTGGGNASGSPVKQVKVKDLPKEIVKGGKKLVKKIGDIELVSKERKDCKAQGLKGKALRDCIKRAKGKI